MKIFLEIYFTFKMHIRKGKEIMLNFYVCFKIHIVLECQMYTYMFKMMGLNFIIKETFLY